jgi:hypothetical protein
MSYVIILTSTVNVKPNINCMFQKDKNERINTYMKSVLQWLNKTNCNIVLVENSGYDYSSELSNENELYKNRFEIISYNENELEESKYLLDNISKGDSEIFSINYAYRQSKLIKEIKPIFIIKITGRFFIPDLEEYFKSYDLNNYDCLSQHYMLQSEMIGSHYSNFDYIFSTDTHNSRYTEVDFIETVYFDRKNNCKRILVCKLFDIEETQTGSNDVRVVHL